MPTRPTRSSPSPAHGPYKIPDKLAPRRPHGVVVTNVRFGFVDTKMAKSNVRPFMMPASGAGAPNGRARGTKITRSSAPNRPICSMRRTTGSGRYISTW